jgi:uncharacterized circularly permuted ATP-grasp superfamily protein
LIPFDIIPRIISRAEWSLLEQGLRQRVETLNAFLNDIYSGQECLKAGIIPSDLVLSNPSTGWRWPACPRRTGSGVHIACGSMWSVPASAPSTCWRTTPGPLPACSYMLEIARWTMRLAPEPFASHHVAPVETYTDALLATRPPVAPRGADGEPTIVLLTPGRYNSAF